MTGVRSDSVPDATVSKLHLHMGYHGAVGAASDGAAFDEAKISARNCRSLNIHAKTTHVCSVYFP